MEKKEPKTIHDILKDVNMFSVLRLKNIASQLIELYGDDPYYKDNKAKLIVELKIAEDYLNSQRDCSSSSLCSY